ncbi:dynamin family protein [Fredinandcohnia sp. 179-A 10B2 NHS]|uniref:dynamin family protein n=1 Tax=Fredinandcohnia sp. 179-A 10B2 NHS TaxID=3235176 RepID=UPI0039A0AD04
MIQTEKIHTQLTKEALLNRMSLLYELIDKNEDKDNGKKILQLIEKLHKSEYMIGFSGHFSAGKSSMINELIGENLLPSSPIPTSANLVKVKTGREYARVYYNDGKIIEYPAPYDYDVIKAYCKDGETIGSIEISHKDMQLPENVTIMDTPGIDSTDDAHRISTESALHLADLLFYVMDYNHVLSELNFEFTKELADRNKPLYLIVNQVDKHNESELSFESFKQGVEEAFRNWNVSYQNIYYTTLKDDEHQYNELQQVKKLLHEKIKNKDELLLDGVYHSAKQIILDHISFLDDKNSTEVEVFKEKLSTLSQSELGELTHKIETLSKQGDSFEKEQKKLEEEFLKGVDAILSNSILMPFETRELAKRFVESVQPEFKVGLLFSKNKTEKERDERLQIFFSDVKEKVSTQLEWHLKDYLSKYISDKNLSRYQKSNDEISVEILAEDLQSLVKPGARVTGEYILTYTEDISRYIKKKYKQQALAIFESILIQLKKEAVNKKEEISRELANYLQYQEALEKLKKFDHARNLQLSQLQNIMNGNVESMSSKTVEELLSKLKLDNIEVSSTEEVLQNLQKQQIEGNLEKPTKQVEKDTKLKSTAEQAISHLEEADKLISPITGLSLIAKDMKEKAYRLRNKHYTVALFGAFSAGKSSFANALMGNAVLPVSPNPTTATINKITFPTKERSHGTVLIKLKSKQQLLDDINHSLHVFGEQAQNIETSLNIITSKITNISTIEAKEKPHFAFLEAVVKGYQSISSAIGTVMTSNIDGFNDFVANEEKACFVEWIELYYDCPLTRQGITLVDTPGADSINARHTGVAFEYIKNADAILFVTYYNHAFSKADREFLIQLGRVKDTFSMDKMFFIINAADLANSMDELADVKDYVESQLISYGIRFPRLYTVSSRAALKEKQNENSTKERGVLQSSGIEKFEIDFHDFIVDELTEVAINEAYVDIKRASTIIDSYISSANESKESKQIKLQTVKKEHEKISALIRQANEEELVTSVNQEITELSYYIKQRIFLRVPDMFKEAFNPTTLRDDGRDIKKALQSCLDELLESVGFDLAQEMRATSLRIESFILKRLHQQLHYFNESIKNITADFSISESLDHQFKSLEFNNGLEEEDKTRYKKALTLFKSPKTFFEKNEKKQMLDAIEVLLQSPVDTYLKEKQVFLQESYSTEVSQSVGFLKEKALHEVNEFFDGATKFLSEDIDTQSLEEASTLLKSFYKEQIG